MLTIQNIHKMRQLYITGTKVYIEETFSFSHPDRYLLSLKHSFDDEYESIVIYRDEYANGLYRVELNDSEARLFALSRFNTPITLLDKIGLEYYSDFRDKYNVFTKSTNNIANGVGVAIQPHAHPSGTPKSNIWTNILMAKLNASIELQSKQNNNFIVYTDVSSA